MHEDVGRDRVPQLQVGETNHMTYNYGYSVC